MLAVLQLYSTLSDILYLCDGQMYVNDITDTVIYSSTIPYSEQCVNLPLRLSLLESTLC